MSPSRAAALPTLLLAVALGPGCQAQRSTEGSRADTPAPSQAHADAPAAKAAPVAATPPAIPWDGTPKPVLVELFTSQGCNSCPPADAFIGEFAALGWKPEQVIPLTFHVTYWDDLGWSDPFAKQLFDQRQISYAQRVPAHATKAKDENTIRGPYTPQMVVDGRVHFSGTLREVAREQVEQATKTATFIELSARASIEGDRVQVNAESAMTKGAGLDTDKSKIGIFAALAQARVQTEVPRGENAGKQLQEFSVVREFQGPKLFRSHRERNETQFTLAVPEGVAAADLSVVVFVQDLANLGVYTAARVPLNATG